MRKSEWMTALQTRALLFAHQAKWQQHLLNRYGDKTITLPEFVDLKNMPLKISLISKKDTSFLVSFLSYNILYPPQLLFSANTVNPNIVNQWKQSGKIIALNK